MVKRLRAILVVAGLSAAAAACASRAEIKEDMLSSSGFRAVPAKTPRQLASLKSLPAHKLTKATYKGAPAWVYADPTVCGCLYIGNQDAHDAYLKKAAQAKATDAKEAANARAAMDSMADLGLDWE